MEVVFDGELFVHYGFVYLSTESEQGDPGSLDLAFAGQRNGLCGAAVPHRLTMLTGTHTGDVPFRVEWHADAPASQDSWEDVVEVSLDVQSAAVELSSFDDFREAAVRRTGPHRVRYSVVGMDAALEPADDDAPVPDRCLVQLWPATSAPDEILRVGTERAQYWHESFGGSPALSADEIAAARSAEPDVEAAEDVEYGGDFVDGDERQADVVSRLLAAPAEQQRGIARWLARRAVTEALLSDEPAFAAALAALDDGRPLPAPFDDFAAAASMATDLEPPGAASTGAGSINDPEPDDDFGWYAPGLPPNEWRKRALLSVLVLDSATAADPARAALTAYQHAIAMRRNAGLGLAPAVLALLDNADG